MFQLSTRQVRMMWLLIAVLGVGLQRGAAKCIWLKITVDGEILGPTKGLTVRIEVPSTTKGDSVTHVSQSYSTQGSHFQVVGWFDTTSNVIDKETCNRGPAFVIVNLMRGKQVLDRQSLPIETAFHEVKGEGFELIEPVTLHLPKEK